MARGKESGKRRTRRREMEAKKETKVWTRYDAAQYVKGVKAKLEAIGLPEGTEDEWGRKRFAEAMATYAEMEKGWHNEDMMAAALIDALEMASSVALAEAGGWEGWPKEPIARVLPGAVRKLANPESAAGKAYTALDALYDESIDALMEIRGMKLSPMSPEKLRTHLGEHPHDPRKKYIFANACGELHWWLSEVYRLNLGEVGWLQNEAEWIRRGLAAIDSARYAMDDIRAKEKAIGKLATDVANGAKLDEAPPAEPWERLFRQMKGAAGGGTRMERLVRLGRELGELRAEYDAMPEWAKAADCRR